MCANKVVLRLTGNRNLVMGIFISCISRILILGTFSQTQWTIRYGPRLDKGNPGARVQPQELTKKKSRQVGPVNQVIS